MTKPTSPPTGIAPGAAHGRRHGCSASGFTLIELMIVVIVVALLASIAVPSYNDYMRRAAAQEAFANLADMRVKLEQFYQNNRNYGTAGQTPSCGHDGTGSRVSFAVANGNFTYTCTLTGASPNENQSYTITAAGSGGKASGNDYTLNSDNIKGTIQFKGATVNKNCWLSKGSEC